MESQPLQSSGHIVQTAADGRQIKEGQCIEIILLPAHSQSWYIHCTNGDHAEKAQDKSQCEYLAFPQLQHQLMSTHTHTHTPMLQTMQSHKIVGKTY